MDYLILDVDGVVVHGYHHNLRYRRMWNETLAQDLGLDPQALAQEFFAKDWAPIVRGETELRPQLASALKRIGTDVSADTLIDYWFRHDSNLNHPLLDRVAALRKSGTICHLATNQESLRAAFLWNDLGLKNHFNDMFYSAALKVSKPQLAFFEAVNAAMDFNPHTDTVHYFDDTPDCVARATQAGWKARLYNTLQDFTV